MLNYLWQLAAKQINVLHIRHGSRAPTNPHTPGASSDPFSGWKKHSAAQGASQCRQSSLEECGSTR